MCKSVMLTQLSHISISVYKVCNAFGVPLQHNRCDQVYGLLSTVCQPTSSSVLVASCQGGCSGGGGSHAVLLQINFPPNQALSMVNTQAFLQPGNNRLSTSDVR